MEIQKEFTINKQKELLTELTMKKYISQEVADIIFKLNNQNCYENILTYDNLKITAFANELMLLVKS